LARDYLRTLEMAPDTHLASWHIENLQNRCAEETKHFFQGKDNSTQFCFEIFRRAFIDQNQDAWYYIYHQYQPLVRRWLENHILFPYISEEKDYFINRVFEKLWNALSKDKFLRINNLRTLLQYLKMCVGSVIIDYARAQKIDHLEALDKYKEFSGHEISNNRSTDDSDLESYTLSQIHSQDLWDLVKSLAISNKENCILYGYFMLGLKPREIFEAYYGEFEGIEDVYRTKEYLLDRLRRNHELINFLTND
jgi:hypothetical protein